MPANDKQVILVSGDATKWYEQAIFILRRGQPAADVPKDFISEAESIVRAYLRGDIQPTPRQASPSAMPLPARHAKRKRTNLVLNVMMLLSCFVLTILLALHFLG